MPNYGDFDYWEKRYKSQPDTMFDWLEDYDSIKDILYEVAPDKDAKILVLGCGNAEFSEQMYEDGYKNITNNDISVEVINQMKERNAERPEMTYDVMDVTEMTYPDETFDLAIDKSTLDALLCGDGAFLMMAKLVNETQRVLKTGGYYVAISYGKPENRSFHFKRDNLNLDLKITSIFPADCQTEEEKDEKSHYVYICEKLLNA